MGNTTNKTKLDIKILQKGGYNSTVLHYYHLNMIAISNYLSEPDINIKTQYYMNNTSKKIFDRMHIIDPEYAVVLGRLYNYTGTRHLILSIIWLKMGTVWNPLERPLMKKAVENGLLTWDMLYMILDKPTTANTLINKRIQEKLNAPSVAAQNVRNSRKGIELQLQGKANRLNNILYQKEREKNNAGVILTNAQNNYQNALNEYNKKLNDLK